MKVQSYIHIKLIGNKIMIDKILLSFIICLFYYMCVVIYDVYIIDKTAKTFRDNLVIILIHNDNETDPKLKCNDVYNHLKFWKSYKEQIKNVYNPC